MYICIYVLCYMLYCIYIYIFQIFCTPQDLPFPGQDDQWSDGSMPGNTMRLGWGDAHQLLFFYMCSIWSTDAYWFNPIVSAYLCSFNVFSLSNYFWSQSLLVFFISKNFCVLSHLVMSQVRQLPQHGSGWNLPTWALGSKPSKWLLKTCHTTKIPIFAKNNIRCFGQTFLPSFFDRQKFDGSKKFHLLSASMAWCTATRSVFNKGSPKPERTRWAMLWKTPTIYDSVLFVTTTVL